MLDIDYQLPIELIRVIAHANVALFIGCVLLFLLALHLFPRFASMTRIIVARKLKQTNFRKGSRLQGWALALASWLSDTQPDFVDNPKHLTFEQSAGKWREKPSQLSRLKKYRIGGQIAQNRCYETRFAVQASPARPLIGDRQDSYVVKLSSNATGDRLLKKECHLINRLRSQAFGTSFEKYLPQKIESFRHRRRQINVFQHDSHRLFSAEQIVSRYPTGLDGRHVAWMFNRMLEAIGFFHRQETVHCAILPQHLLFEIETHSLQIVDWTHAKQIGQRIRHIPRRHENWFPVEALRRDQITAATDIYMAAQVAVCLSGGDPFNHEIPHHLPLPMRRFLQACLLESPNMRPHDAWELHEEFRDLLEGVYGPPKFHQLQMN